MAAKKAKKVVPLEQYSKSALIALVKKLQREVTRLKALVDVPPLKVTHVEPGEDMVSDLVPRSAYAPLEKAADEYRRARRGGKVPAPHDEPGISEDLESRAIAEANPFPWEKK